MTNDKRARHELLAEIDELRARLAEREAAAEILRESEERFLKAFNASPHLMTITALDGGQYLAVNEAVLDATGYTREEMIGHTADELGLFPQGRATLLDAFRDGVVRDLEIEVRLKSGEARLLKLSADIITVQGRRCVLTSSLDITESRQAEKNQEFLLEIAETIRRALNVDELLSGITEAVGRYLQVSRCAFDEVNLEGGAVNVRSSFHAEGVAPDAATYSISSFSRETLANIKAGRTIVNADAKSDARTAPLYASSYLPHGFAAYVAVPLMREGRWVSTLWANTETPRRWTRQEVSLLETAAERAWLAVERLRSEAALQQALERERAAREQAEAHNRAKDDFLSVVTHELRSPLNAILGYTRLARSSAHDAALVAQHCDTIERAARTQQKLIDDLLDTARILTGKLRIDAQPCDLRLVLEDTLAVVQPAADAKGIQIEMETGESGTGGWGLESAEWAFQFPGLSSQPLIVLGDAVRLQQVVWNLLQNAVKFTPTGGRIELRMEQVGQRVDITVSDTGCGIAPDYLGSVFDRFSQADASRSRRHGGLGLGLALVKQLVELHGGEIKVTSEGLGHGATFTVRLPLRAPQLEIPRPVRAITTEVRTGADAIPIVDLPSLAGVRVLAVDDQAEARELIAASLRQHGAQVTALSSGEEALLFLADPPPDAAPDVLILDISMPDEDGYAVLRRVRALETARGIPPAERIPAIALTAHTRSEDRLAALRGGFQMHVGKPVELAELIVVIAALKPRRQGATLAG